jgi:hypothetical protein
MRVEVTIDAIMVEALPRGMSTEALQAAVAASIAAEVRALGPGASRLAASPAATAAFSLAVGQTLSRRLGT